MGKLVLFLAMFLGYNQYWPGGFMGLWILCPGASGGSTDSGSDFNASKKTGPRIKVSSNRLGETGNWTCDLWFTMIHCNSYKASMRADHFLYFKNSRI